MVVARSTRRSPLAFAALLGLAVALGLAIGCGYDGHLGAVACEEDADCPEDAVCDGEYCLFDEDSNDGFNVNQHDECPDDNVECGDDCVDTSIDGDHCGECDNACDDDQFCADGSCISGDPECPDGQIECDDECIDPLTDAGHCGECDNSCGADETCQSGSCTPDCPAGQTLCGDECVDTDDDADHCGECNDPCAGDEHCTGGQCTTECDDDQPDQLLCDDECIDPLSRSDHCGGCDQTCAQYPGTQVGCDGGECEWTCTDPTGEDVEFCADEGLCADLSDDPEHCGECDNECPEGPTGSVPVCQDHECGLECTDDDEKLCDDDGTDQCVDIQSNEMHCGGCNTVCPTDPDGETTCEDGDCQLECDGDLQACSEECVDTETDENHCGDCGVDCGTGEICRDGGCVEIPECESTAPFGGGSGTPDDPWTICERAHLMNIDSDVEYLDDHFAMADDIDLENDDFEPLARGTSDGDLLVDIFQGRLEGNGFAIENLEIGTTQPRAGLFGAIGTGGEVVDLKLVDVEIDAEARTGSLAGANAGTIEDVRVVQQDETNTVAGTVQVGGLVGWQTTDGEIEDVDVAAEVTGTDHSVGGLVGTTEGSISNVDIETHVTATGVTDANAVGGVVGRNEGEIVGVDVEGAVEANEEAGGIAGVNEHEIDDVEAHVDVTADEGRAGGIVGRQREGGSTTDCEATGDVTSTDDNTVGGAVGWLDGSDTRLEDCSAHGDIAGQAFVGGLVGHADGLVTDSQATGTVEGVHSVGGLVGRAGDEAGHPVQIVRSHADATVSGSEEFVGGLVGDHYGTIVESVATGDVNPDQTQGTEVGGLVGRLRGAADVQDSYAVGSVAGDQAVGGLAGHVRDVFGFTGEIHRSHSTGEVTANDDAGGLIGTNGADSMIGDPDNVYDSYWNTDTSGQAESTGGQGVPDADYGQTGSFEGFDFDDVWTISDTDNRPYLQWEDD